MHNRRAGTSASAKKLDRRRDSRRPIQSFDLPFYPSSATSPTHTLRYPYPYSLRSRGVSTVTHSPNYYHYLFTPQPHTPANQPYHGHRRLRP